MAETLYQTGARVSEIVALRRDHVKVAYTSSCSCSAREQGTAGDYALELYGRIVATFPEDSEYLFTTDQGNPYRRTYITREIDRAARRVLGGSVTAHVLRNSHATDLIATTGKVKGVPRMLSHASKATTLRYYAKQSLTEEELFEGV
jgi:integrase